MFDFLFSERTRRQRLLKRTPEGPLRQYLAAPLPDLKKDILEVPLLVVDFETNGLNTASDEILSVGYVEVIQGQITLSSAHHKLIKNKQDLSEESVIIHKITDDVSASGEPFENVIGELLKAMEGKVIVAHNAKIETSFLARACQKLYGVKPEFQAIDTLQLAKRWFDRRHREIAQGDLRLFNLRKTYGLPVYQAHNALSDAISTAELLQAQIAHMDSDKVLPLKQFIF